MKKFICILLVLSALLVSSAVAFADPKGVPGSGTEPTLIYISK